jgi:hypothetical protein
MEEARLANWYETGRMVESDAYARTLTYANFKDQDLIGLLIEDRCPQCGARTWLNRNGNQWCWNCGWDNFIYKCNH